MDKKTEKDLKKEQKAAEKAAELEKTTNEDYEAKKANSKGTPTEQLKVWLDKTPFKSTNTQLKKDTFFTVINQVMALKQVDIDNLCGDDG